VSNPCTLDAHANCSSSKSSISCLVILLASTLDKRARQHNCWCHGHDA